MPHGLMGSSGELQNMHMMGGAAMMMAAAHAAHNGSGSPGGPRGGHVKLGRGVVDPAAYQHKLFIGQIPFEVRKEWLVVCASVRCVEHPCTVVHWRLAWAARRHVPNTSSALLQSTPQPSLPSPPPPPLPLQAIEQDLWALFVPVGDILELAILRSQGRSKGCAFLTYATRQQVGGGGGRTVCLADFAALQLDLVMLAGCAALQLRCCHAVFKDDCCGLAWQSRAVTLQSYSVTPPLAASLALPAGPDRHPGLQRAAGWPHQAPGGQVC